MYGCWTGDIMAHSRAQEPWQTLTSKKTGDAGLPPSRLVSMHDPATSVNPK